MKHTVKPSQTRRDTSAVMQELTRENRPDPLEMTDLEMRHAARVADEHDDPGSVDLFSKLVQIHERHEWWLRDILRKGDGFHLNGELR